MHIEHVIYLSSAGCALWSWRETGFAESAVRTPVGEDPGPVAMALAGLAPGPVAVLVDTTDEEHVRETVARLGRGDQQALLERKLARAFPRTPYRIAQVQGRSAASPDEDQVLLSALTRPEPLRVLMTRLADARIPVAGIFSPALLTGRLLDPDAQAAPAAMLVLRRSNGRLQHSFFRHGRLVGSRRLRAVAVLDDPGLMLRQIEESLRYFDATFAVGAENPLQVLLAPGDLEQLGTIAARAEGWYLRPFDVAGLCRRLGIRASLVAAESERAFIELLRRHAGPADFASAGERRYFSMFRVRSFARVACVAIAGAALAGTLYNALFMLEAGQRLTDSSATVDQLGAALPGDGANGTLDPREMQRAVTAYDALAGHMAEPGDILAAIGAAVSERPRIRLDAIQWTVAGPVPADEGDVPAAPADDSIIVTLKGHVAPFRGDFPAAFAEMQAFADALREDPAVVSVTPRAEPLDVDPASTLTGEFAPGTVESQAPFTLEVAMKPGPAGVAPAAGLAAGDTDEPG